MPSQPVVRICCAQITGTWEDPAQTLERAGYFIRHASSSGADLICFPEQFSTGWDPKSTKNLEEIDGSIVSSLKELARDNNIAILGSFRQEGAHLPKNTAFVVGNDGHILSTYAKIHLFGPAGEDERFLPGTDLGIFSLGPLTCGIAICYDLRFPELFQIYAKRGAQVIFVPAAWPEKRILHWELFIRTRAAENQVYIVGVNTTGITPVDYYSGDSMIADPHGTIIQRATEAEQLLFVDLDPAVVETARRSFPVEKDRKDGLYRTLLAEKPSRSGK
jgi:predicted amidohydrolase